MRALVVAGLSVLLLAGCQKSPWAQKAQSAAAAQSAQSVPAKAESPYNTELSVKDLMDHAIDPAADLVWAASGYVVDMQGTHDMSPTTPEGWAKVTTNAAIVAELSNALMVPGRSPDEPKWNEFANKLHVTAMESMKAAQNRDKAGLLHAGSDMFLACTACHKYYVLGEKD